MSASFAPVPRAEASESPSGVVVSPTTTPRFTKVYRSGFSSSICDLFANPYDRSSFCALACCGILLQDRNRFVVHQQEPSWWKRVAVNAGGFVVLFVVCAVILVPLGLGGAATLIIPITILGVRGTLIRMKFRRQLMDQLPSPVAPYGEQGFCADHRRAHRCCGFVPVDIIYVPAAEDDPQASVFTITDMENTAIDNKKDSCFYLWRLIAASCCGSCGVWCTCCGMCATAQEDREIRRLYPKERFMMDYITMQPFQEYYPSIENLRRVQDTSFWSHLQAMSKLSKRLVRVLEMGLLILLALSVVHVFKHFNVAHVVVIVLTLLQAFAVVYLVHWRKHRFDVSLDAVVKFFASGFILAFSIALMLELVTSTLGSLFFNVFFVAELTEDNQGNPDNVPTTQQRIFYELAQHHLPTLLAFLFFQTFVTASLIEELTKFFCFWIVEHPDLSFIPSDAGGTQEEGDLEQQQAPESSSVHSKAAAITVGLVCTAAGFACVENLMYSLGAGSSVSKEITVLLMRSALPIHPICAGIQSIGIVRRDVEGDGTCELGRALFPAILLHGTFDFVIMTIAVLALRHGPPPPDNADDKSDESLQESGTVSLIGLAIAFVIGLLGFLYYLVQAKKQRERLNALEAATRGTGTNPLL